VWRRDQREHCSWPFTAACLWRITVGRGGRLTVGRPSSTHTTSHLGAVHGPCSPFYAPGVDGAGAVDQPSTDFKELHRLRFVCRGMPHLFLYCMLAVPSMLAKSCCFFPSDDRHMVIEQGLQSIAHLINLWVLFLNCMLAVLSLLA